MSDSEALWAQLGDDLVASDPAISRSTMMGLPCLRLNGAFFASFDTRSGDLILKLTADDVTARVESGDGKPFAPAGKIFRQWLAIEPGPDEVWRAALGEALTFARDVAAG